MEKERILKLCEAGFSIFEIAKALEIDVEIVRDVAPYLHTGRRNKDYMIMQQILCEIREEQRLSKLRASTAHATAATIESHALALLLQRVHFLHKLEKEDVLSTKESYELCKILKTIQPLLQSQDSSPTTASRSCIEVSFV